MRTVLEILKLSTEYLQQRGIANPRRQAEDLISDALGIDRLHLYLQFDRPIVQQELDLCRSRLSRRAQGEPSQYIHGEVEFYGCQIKVSPAVLIPRQETEILVDKIAQQLSTQDLTGKSLWDMCCGSGCIGIALKKRFPQLDVSLSDVSAEALAVAKINAEANSVEVHLYLGDFFEPFKGKKVNFFVCNPPYVTEQEYAQLDREVRDYEPRRALVAGPSGLECYQHLANEIEHYLAPKGQAWFEIGKEQGQKVSVLFTGMPGMRYHIEADWSGHDRFFFLERE